MKEIDNAIENLKFATIQKNVMERHHADKLVKYISGLKSQNTQLLETVESLKCCGNCKHAGDGDCYSYQNLCYREPNKFSEEKKDYWEQR